MSTETALAARRLSLAAFAIAVAPAMAWSQSVPCLWDPVEDSPVPRFESPSVVVDGKMIVFGGFRTENLVATDQVDVYDPQADTWTQVEDMPTAVTHQGVALVDRQVWFAGGFDGNHPGPVVDDVWFYDVDLDTWTAGPALPGVRGAGALVHYDGYLYFFGGVIEDRDTNASDHWRLDLSAPTVWEPRAPLPNGRCHLAGIEMGGLIYAVGGQYGHDTSPEDLALVHVYDPQADSWSALTSMPEPRSHAAAATFELNGRIVVAGGRSIPTGQIGMSSVVEYDIGTDTWHSLPPLPAPLVEPSVKVIGGEMILVGGALKPTVPLDSTLVRDLSAVVDPIARLNAGGDPFTSTVTGNTFCIDNSYIGGQSFTSDDVTSIAGTEDDELYFTEHTGSSGTPDRFRYEFGVANGPYRVILHFAEIYWGAPGGGGGAANRRVFDVRIEGVKVLDDYDIWATVGAVTADVYSFDTVVNDGVLEVRFDATIDRPKVSAIEVIPLADGYVESYCETAPNSVGAGAMIGYSGTLVVAANDFVLEASGAPPIQPGLFIQGPEQIQLPFGDGWRCVGQALRLNPPIITSAAGEASRLVDFPNPPQASATIVAGSTWNFQFWYRDSGSFNLTDGLGVTFAQ